MEYDGKAQYRPDYASKMPAFWIFPTAAPLLDSTRAVASAPLAPDTFPVAKSIRATARRAVPPTAPSRPLGIIRPNG